MAKTYVLKEPDYLRQQALEAVALLRYMRVFSDGKEISPIDEDAAARYDRILEQILRGVPLKQIVELQEIFEELRQAQERRRAFREYKTRLRVQHCTCYTTPLLARLVSESFLMFAKIVAIRVQRAIEIVARFTKRNNR